MSNTAQTIKPNAKASGSFYKAGLGVAVGLSPLLEQKIAVYSEGNTANQSEIIAGDGTLTPLTSKEVAVVAGYGSPSHLAAMMLFDNLNVDVEVKFFFVPEAGGGTVTEFALTGTGATITTTGTLVLNINGELVSIPLIKDETLAQVLVKIKDAINAQINLPVEVLTATPVTDVDITTKWVGQSSIELNVTIESNDSVGIAWALVKTPGTGEVIPTTELAKMLNDWYPHVLNCLGNGASESILDEFESFNGTPSAGNGKYSPENWTPFVSWTGTTEDVLANLTAITSPRLDKNTNVYVPTPNSQNWTFLTAAEFLGMFVKKSNGDPKQDIVDDVMLYAIPPIDNDVGDIINYSFRDNLVENGCSTSNFKNESYYTGDVLTTYHPDGETDPIFRYVRDNMITFNIVDQFKKFNERQKNKTIAPNALPSIHITSPELYKAGILNEIIKPFVELGYIADFDYAKDNLDVGINPTNAGRFDVLSPNLITSLLRIVANEIQVNKFYGN